MIDAQRKQRIKDDEVLWHIHWAEAPGRDYMIGIWVSDNGMLMMDKYDIPEDGEDGQLGDPVSSRTVADLDDLRR